MDITVSVTQEEINKAIGQAVRALAKKEVSRIVNELYVRDNKAIRLAVQEAVTQAIYELFAQPEIKEFIMDTGKDVAARKALSMVRNGMVRQNEHD